MLYISIETNNPANFDKVFSIQLHNQANRTFIVHGKHKVDALQNVVYFCIEHGFTEDFFQRSVAWRLFLDDGYTFTQVAGKYLLEESMVIEEIEDYRF